MADATCIDCRAAGVKANRPTPHGGPRSPLCVTHWRERRRRNRKRAHDRHVEKRYEITGEEYDALYEAQGGKCYGCQKATGKSKMLAVEHEHGKQGCDHPPEVGCRKCIRCLACGPCNETLGRYDVKALARLITILTNPPAQQILREYDARMRG